MDVLPEAGKWTEAAYYPLSEEGRLVELSDGDIEVTELPTDVHQLILLRFVLALHSFVSQRKPGLICFAPIPVRLWPGKVREPDLVYMSAGHIDRVGDYWGVPDLAVEILSPSTAHKDREVKRIEYAQAGVIEYWIVDPEAKSVEVLTRSEESSVYDRVSLFEQDETLVSGIFPGLAVSLADLFNDEPTT